jgi:hypothetical protein
MMTSITCPARRRCFEPPLWHRLHPPATDGVTVSFTVRWLGIMEQVNDEDDHDEETAAAH